MILPVIMILLDQVTKKKNHSLEDTEHLILSRIPSLETLDRCKAVCKGWRKIINEENSFMSSYCQNTGNMYGYLLQVRENVLTHKYRKGFASIIKQQEDGSFVPSYTKFDKGGGASSNTNLKFDVEDYIIASSMQGILLCAKCNVWKLCVCKPTTGQWQEIPHRSWLGVLAAGLIILSNKPLRYKIIWISRNNSKHCYEIFDSKTWNWSERVELSLPCAHQSYNEQGIQVGIFLYFLMDTFILAFHGYNEESFRIRFPEPLTSSPVVVRNKTIEYQGKPGLICMTLERPSSMQLWILEDYNEMTSMPTWKKIKEIDMSFLGPNSGDVYPVGSYSADILVLKNNKSLLLCNIQDFTYKELKFNKQGYRFDTFPFRSDREAVELRLSDSVTCLCVDVDRKHITFSAFITFLLFMIREKLDGYLSYDYRLD